MKNVRRMMFATLLCMLASAAMAESAVYRITMSLYVPRVYDNTQSLGYRKVQRQTISGYVVVEKEAGVHEPVVTAMHLVNKTHKVQKANVTYSDADAEDVMWRYIGSNKTGVFRNVQVKFSLDLDPSYNIGADEPDNALIVTLAGRGSSEDSIRGAVTGQIGCGCTAYGHVSPTRTIWGLVSDITPLYGTFTMRRVRSVVHK